MMERFIKVMMVIVMLALAVLIAEGIVFTGVALARWIMA